MTILKTYTLFKQFGDKIFEELVYYTYDLTKEFAKLINANSEFETAHDPDSRHKFINFAGHIIITATYSNNRNEIATFSKITKDC